MTRPIRVLMVEDSEDDALLMLRTLEKGGYEPEYRRVETVETMRDALAAEAWDLILCDYTMPRFDGLAVLRLMKETGLDLPFIVVSGTIGEETAVASMKAGAHDYIMKDRLHRLVPAVQRELRDAGVRREHKKTEEALRESNERYRHLFELESDAILLIDNETGRILEANRAAAELYGYGSEELLTKRNTDLSAEPEETRRVTEETPMAADQVVKIPLRHHRKKDGTIFPVEVTGRFFYWKDRPVHIASIRDITELKQVEQALRESEERYRSLVEKSLAGVYVVQDGRFVFLNHNAASFAGYRPEELVGRPSDSILHPEDSIFTLQEARKRLREESTSPHEFRIITRDGRVRWIMEMVTSIQYNGRSAILGNSVDITDRKEGLERLRKALGGTVQAISMAVETKDPYTAGHQRRTADLARAIATEMGLDADRRDFIRIAATIHDIGKIALPAEILSKPTKLTEIEFSLIKTHALQGYQILKGIEFPWPVADVVLQHHERIDGSGYPDGLRGEDILLEARILSVADVVEAIASHRPYRPAHGIDDALDEISKNRGILYDADAVDACLTLFREKMYHLF